MEELLAVALQLVLEIGLQLFGSLGFDAATETARRNRGTSGAVEEHDGCGWLLLFALFGGACGGLSLLFAPKLLLPNLALRLVNLAAAPLVAGGISYAFAKFGWAPRGPCAGHHFWRGFWFALAFGLVRFAYAGR